MSLTLPQDDTGKVCLPCPEGAICSGGTAMPFPKKGWWIDRSSYTAGSVAFRCLRATCEGFQARANEWAQRANPSINDFDFGGFSTLDGDSYDVDDDQTITDDDYVGLSGVSLAPLACWHRSAFINASEAAYTRHLQSSEYSLQLDLPQCTEHRLMCTQGSVGPLCGSCDNGFVFSTSSRLCINCQRPITFVPLLMLGIFLVVVMVLWCILLEARKNGLNEAHFQKLHHICRAFFLDFVYNSRTKTKTKNLFRHLDRGMLKVAWVTFQILSSISWNLAVQYPEPFATAPEALRFVSLDLSVVLKCSSQMNFMHRTLFATLVPLLLFILDLALYLARRARRRTESREAFKISQKERDFRLEHTFTDVSVDNTGTSQLHGRISYSKPGMDNVSNFRGCDSSIDHGLEAALELMQYQHVYFALVLSYLVIY